MALIGCLLRSHTKNRPAIDMASTQNTTDDPMARAWSIITQGDKNRGAASNPVFTCDFPPKAIPLHYVNDDYCDCLDASDEPLTSACSGIIYAHNQQVERYRFSCDVSLPSFASTGSLRGAGVQGVSMIFLPPSRINDGYCDW